MSKEITDEITQVRGSGKNFYELKYTLTKTDDLGSSIERFEDYARFEGATVSDWEEDQPSVKGKHAIRAMFVWDDKGKREAIRRGYKFSSMPTEPSEEEQLGVEEKLAELAAEFQTGSEQ